ncbi:hypothetical protein BdWA1_002934 [Babesia duncani]|uniref:Uncharacterized protein n=1 Tax=Babesia duncani TaxID=323732 RepID=A0AAD9PIM4_9APIC|nr:hypothetical protein BdWA1_002934 [Babesia duncani]
MGSALHKAAMWFAGFNLCQTLLLVFVGSEFALRRFEINERHVGLFVGIANSGIQLAWLAGILLAFVLAFLEGINSNFKKYWNPVFSIVSIVFCVVLNLALLIVYVISDGFEYINAYFWIHVVSGLAYGINQSVIFKVLPTEGAFATMGLALTGVFLTLLHGIFIPFLKAIGANVDYWLITINILAIFLIGLTTAFLWTLAAIEKINEAASSNSTDDSSSMDFDFQNTWKAIRNATSPILMGVLSLGLVYSVYPLISPLLIVPASSHHVINMMCLIVEAGCGILVYLLCEHADLYGPWKGDYIYWEYLWILAIPIVLVAVLFIYALHHRDSGLYYAVTNHTWFSGFLTFIFYFSGKVFQNAGTSCCEGNARGPSFNVTFTSNSAKLKCKYNGSDQTIEITTVEGPTVKFYGKDNSSASKFEPDNGTGKTYGYVLKNDNSQKKFTSAESSSSVEVKTGNTLTFTSFKLKVTGFGANDSISELKATLCANTSSQLTSDSVKIGSVSFNIKFTSSFQVQNSDSEGTIDINSSSIKGSEIDETSASYTTPFGLVVGMIMLIVSTFCVEAYIRTYTKCIEACEAGIKWPTADYGCFRSFFWWFGDAIANGWGTVRTFFNTDIRQLMTS